MALQLLTSMRNLAEVKHNRYFMVHDEGTLSSLVNFLEHKDEEIAYTALDILYFLSLESENIDRMVNEKGLIEQLQEIRTWMKYNLGDSQDDYTKLQEALFNRATLLLQNLGLDIDDDEEMIDQQIGAKCDYCNKSTATVACGKCKSRKYCCKDCQERDWKYKHSKKCCA